MTWSKRLGASHFFWHRICMKYAGGGMNDSEQLSALISDVYDAALAPASWEETLSAVARFVGGPSAALWSKDDSSNTGNAAYFCGFDPGYTQAYLDQYITLDPASTAHFYAGIDRECFSVPSRQFGLAARWHLQRLVRPVRHSVEFLHRVRSTRLLLRYVHLRGC